jgi:uncharacterized membrane protein
MNIQRIVRHLFTTHGQVGRAFPRSTLLAIEKTVEASEATHAGEIRFAVEAALDGIPLFNGQAPRERALEVFALQRVWDTEHNNGLLIYLLLADRAVEIVADRGIHARVGEQGWSEICRRMEAAFKVGDYESGAIAGIQAAAQHLAAHFPVVGLARNELSNRPVLL